MIPDYIYLFLAFPKVLHVVRNVSSPFLGIAPTTQGLLAFWSDLKFTSTFGTSDKLPVFMETLKRLFIFFVSNFCAFVAIGLVIAPVLLLFFLWQNPTTSFTEPVLLRVMIIIIIIEEPLIPHGTMTE